MNAVLAQSTSYLPVMLSVAAVLAAGLVLVVLAAWARRRLVARKDDPITATGFSLSDLRRLRDEGKMSPEEYERARQLIVATAQKAVAKQAPPPENPPMQTKPPRD